MAQPATIGIRHDLAERDPVSQGIDYGAEYTLLDLPSGAGLRDIEDRARLLFAAFDPDGVPGSLQVPAAERAMRIALAADRLSRYWHGHGKPPPIITPPPFRDEAAASDMQHRCGGRSLVAAAPAVERPPPPLRLVAEPAPAQSRSDAAPATGARQSAALRTAIAERSIRSGAAGRAAQPAKERPLAAAGSVLLKLAMAALVIAAVARVQQYRAEHPTLSAYSDPSTVSVAGMPAGPPVRWAGLRAPRREVFGAAAPAITGRQRRD